jgi:hypothetical protein
VREDDLKNTFEQLRAAPMPVRALTADDIIRGGEAVRKRRRTMAVVGSGVGTTVVVAAAVLVLTLKPGAVPTDPIEPARPTTSASTPKSVETTPSTSPAVLQPVESSTSELPPTSTTSPSPYVPPTSRPVATSVTGAPTTNTEPMATGTPSTTVMTTSAG